MNSLSEKNYKYQAAGRTWVVPKLKLDKMPDGTVALMEDEIERIHRDIANEICGTAENLSKDELEFLCDVAGTPFSEVADYLGVHKSTITKWRKTEVPKNALNLLLKRWFWFRLFGAELAESTVEIRQLEDEKTFLSYARREAIGMKLVKPIRRMRA